MLTSLDRWHAAIHANPRIYRLVLATRILLAAGFIPTGLVKLLGQRFTSIPSSDPIGALFEALYQAGAYWQFIGASQVVAGLLLLVPAGATLGALLFVPIITNIFVITVALDFHGTPFVTGPMLLATLGLLAWDWHRIRGLFTTTPASIPQPTSPRLANAEAWVYRIGALCLLLFFGATRGFATVPTIALIAVGGLMGVAALWWLVRGT
jgi:hypothetical protein